MFNRRHCAQAGPYRRQQCQRFVRCVVTLAKVCRDLDPGVNCYADDLQGFGMFDHRSCEETMEKAFNKQHRRLTMRIWTARLRGGQRLILIIGSHGVHPLPSGASARPLAAVGAWIVADDGRSVTGLSASTCI
jgi:hypothetical protein